MKGTAILVLFLAAMFGSFLRETFDPNSRMPDAEDAIQYIKERTE